MSLAFIIPYNIIYDVLFEKRNADIIRQIEDGSDIVYTWIINERDATKYICSHDLEDITSDPGNWVNECFNSYYGANILARD